MFDYETLRCIWWGLLELFFVFFALTGGRNIGIAILLPLLAKSDSERKTLIDIITPTWAIQQVCFISFASILFAAWPIVYAVFFSGLYFALLLMLFGIMLPPLSFTYRDSLSPNWAQLWDKTFFIGNLFTALMFGIIFGNLLKGIPFHIDSEMRIFYLGDFFGLLNPFAIIVGLISLAMLVMHGATFLQLKTTCDIQVAAKNTVIKSAIVALTAFAIAGLWITHLEGYHISSEIIPSSVSNPLAKFVKRGEGLWLDNYEHYSALAAIPALAFISGGLTIWLSKTNQAKLALISSSIMLSCITLTAGISMFPFLIPSNMSLNTSLTILDSSSSQNTLEILLRGTVFLLVIVSIYIAWILKILRTTTKN